MTKFEPLEKEAEQERKSSRRQLLIKDLFLSYGQNICKYGEILHIKSPKFEQQRILSDDADELVGKDFS